MQGTRAAELALFVVYDSPVCCVCDHPNHYADQPGTDFLKGMPTTWAETDVLTATVGDCLVLARLEAGAWPPPMGRIPGQPARPVRWFLGGITDASSREVELKLDFLADGPMSDTNAEVVEREERFVHPADTLHIRMAPAGGFVARLIRISSE